MQKFWILVQSILLKAINLVLTILRLKRGSWCVIGPKVNDIMLLGHYRLSNNHMKGNWLVIHTFTKIVKQLTYIMYNVNQPLYTRLSTGVR